MWLMRMSEVVTTRTRSALHIVTPLRDVRARGPRCGVAERFAQERRATLDAPCNDVFGAAIMLERKGPARVVRQDEREQAIGFDAEGDLLIEEISELRIVARIGVRLQAQRLCKLVCCGREVL